MFSTFDSYLEHYGVLGMKWGVRRTPEQLGYKNKMSSATKKAVDDYNNKNISDKAFKKKYGESRKKFKKNVKKYTNPVTKKTRIGSDAYYNRAIYGKKGANRIEKRKAEKGFSNSKSKNVELVRQLAVGMTAATAANYFNNPRNLQKIKVFATATVNKAKKTAAYKAGLKKVPQLASQLVYDVAKKKWVRL